MSVATKGQDLGFRDTLHVTAVDVAFHGKRPKGSLRLITTIGSEDYIADIGEGDPVQWTGNIRCSVPSAVLVRIQRKRRLFSTRWKDFTFIQTLLSLDLLPVSDSKRLVTVTFVMSVDQEAASYRGHVTQAVLEPSLSSKVQAAKEKLEKKDVIVDKLGKLWSVVDVIGSIGGALSDIHPAISAATSALKFLQDACEKQESCRDEALELVEQLEPFSSIESRIGELKQRRETQRAVETSSGIIGNLFGSEYQGRLSEMKFQFGRALEAFDRSVQLETFKAVAGIETTAQLELLRNKLSECEEAHFKPGKENTCLEGTRVDLCERAMNWVSEDPTTGRNVFWLRGKAGSGKSTVANTIAKMVEDRRYAMSCFFCRRDDQNLSNPRRVLSTIAYRFAQQHESYRAVICQLINTDPRGAGIAATADLDTQFGRLFEEPLKQTVDPLRPHVVIIDALDECGFWREQANLARCLLALSHLAPWIKVLVTSRDEPAIRNVFTPSTCFQCNINEERSTDDDIRQYVVSQAKDFRVELSTADLRQLVRRAEGLFIWCSTLFRYLDKCQNPKDDLESFLHGERQEESWSQLYQLYDKVLQTAAETKKDISFMWKVLAIIAVAASNRPLSVKAIASFMNDDGLSRERRKLHAQGVVEKLHAVLYVNNSMNGAIRAYHSSFYDFLQQKVTEVASDRDKVEAVHSRMFHSCMSILDAELCFNVCNIETPVLNKDIRDLNERISTNLSEELQYSSRFWFTHLIPSNLSKFDVAESVSTLLCSKKLLFWLESLSLQDSLSQSLLALETCMVFLQGFADIVATASDAHRFVASFSEAMESVPHIYLSSLFWLPQRSRTYQNLGLSSLRHLQLITNKQGDWDAVVWQRSVGKGVRSLAYSPNGRHIASGAEDGSIKIWDARTGAPEGALSAHNDNVNSLAYSPDGCFLVSGSDDQTVRIWDAKTGEPYIGPLRGHTAYVLCVAFSPDGKFIASSSGDGTIRIWNARTGEPVGEPLQGHNSRVWAVAYSPDGQYIASGGTDCSIRIWSTASRKQVRPPLLGHEKVVYSVKYSPDGRTVISGSGDHTIRIWDVRTGQAIGVPLRGHTGEVLCVMYSHDGRLILSNSTDCTMRIWDVTSGAPIGQPLQGHSDRVRSASYSPDALFIASASDDGSVRLWDLPSNLGTQDQLQGHISTVYAVACSPDGQHIATGLGDDSICLWSAQTGLAMGKPFRGHTRAIHSIAYSPDGECIVSGSRDGTVRIWDTHTGQAIGEPLRGHSDFIQSVTYSPNGRYIASASDDCTVRLWDAQTRRTVCEPLQVRHLASSVAFSPDGHSLACGSWDGTITVWDVSSSEVSIKMTLQPHSRAVYTVAFSPDGRHIASGSSDKTVQVCDANTGEPCGISLQDHTDVVRCVVYSPDGCLIASCSDDCTIRIWDARTRLAVGGPLQGHSSRIYSVAFSPDSRSLVSGGAWTFMYDIGNERSSPPRSEAATSWLTGCSHMDERDGWVKNGETLLLWTPVPYRPILRSLARFMVGNYGVLAPEVDLETLLLYSGQAWENILSDIQRNL